MNLWNHSLNRFTDAGIEVKPSLKARLESLNNTAHESIKTKKHSIDRLTVIADLHAREGLQYDDKESFFDALNSGGVDCQGYSFLYSLALNKVPEDETYLVNFRKPKNGEAHVTLGNSENFLLWDTTIPGLIHPIEMHSDGFAQMQEFNTLEAFSMPDAIAVSHLSSKNEDQVLYDFIDSMNLNEIKYPSQGFYLKHKLKSLNVMYKSGKLYKEEYFDKSLSLLQRLSLLDGADTDLTLQIAKILLMRGRRKDLDLAVELLEDISFTLDTDLVSRQRKAFMTGQAYLLRFIEKQTINDSIMAVRHFKTTHELDPFSDLGKAARKSLESLNSWT